MEAFTFERKRNRTIAGGIQVFSGFGGAPGHSVFLGEDYFEAPQKSPFVRPHFINVGVSPYRPPILYSGRIMEATPFRFPINQGTREEEWFIALTEPSGDDGHSNLVRIKAEKASGSYGRFCFKVLFGQPRFIAVAYGKTPDGKKKWNDVLAVMSLDDEVMVESEDGGWDILTVTRSGFWCWDTA